LADVRDYDEDVKTGVPTIPVLLKSPLNTRTVLTAVQGAVMIAFLHNPFVVGNCCFTIALAVILGKDSPKVYFRLSLHSQSIFIVMYAVMSVSF
jgi:1,4-dihydroxy-2-naphthoate octaprenyltransferase